MSQTSQSPLDNYQSRIEDLVASGLTDTQIARELSDVVQTTRDSIRRARKRWGVTRPDPVAGQQSSGVRIEGHQAEVVSKPSVDPNIDTERIIRDHGLNPDEYVESSITLNEWDSPSGDTMHQVKVNLRRKPNVTLPGPAEREPGTYINRRTNGRQNATQSGLVVFTGDQQAPFHDQELHERFIEWLADNQPERGIMLGDTVDLPDVSRHRLNPENTASVQECINAGHALIRDYVEASPDTQWVKLHGNHDERIRTTLIDWAVQLYNLKRAEVEGMEEGSVLSIPFLLRLDELGVEYIQPNGGYEHEQVNISPYLAARHGWLATKGSGTSALKTLEHLGYSIIVGHTHRQSHVHKTTHDIMGNPTTLAAAEAGCMCEVKDGLGYTVAPDWQQGFATAQVWDDGMFKLDLATYVDGALMWRDKRYG